MSTVNRPSRMRPTTDISPPAPVWVQLDMARRRLSRFAHLQAARARDGWRIIATEWETSPGALPALDIPDEAPIGLRARIDRIDERDGELAILDYKTSAKPKSPEQTHGKPGRWKDLQLPLYRYLYPGAADSRRVRLGYITLPSETDQAQLQEAHWSQADLDDAVDRARAVVSEIRRSGWLGSTRSQQAARGCC